MIGPSASCSWVFHAQLGHDAGTVPPFRVADRDRDALAFGAAWTLGAVQLRARGDVLRDVSGNGERVAGAGDLRLGTVVATPRWRSLGGTVGWEVKLPSAADEGELGTDETDLLFGAGLRAAHGPWWGGAAVGLAILGNPLRYANQDDVPMVRAELGWSTPVVAVAPAFTWDLPTSRNPSRPRLGIAADAGGRLRGTAAFELGLAPAAPDWSVALGLAFRSPLPDAGDGG